MRRAAQLVAGSIAGRGGSIAERLGHFRVYSSGGALALATTPESTAGDGAATAAWPRETVSARHVLSPARVFGEQCIASKPLPKEARSWDDVPCHEDAKEPLKAAGLGAHVGLALLRQGYAAVTDLGLLSEDVLRSLGLLPLEMARLAALCREHASYRVTPSSGALQDLADVLAERRGLPTVIDMRGLTFSGPIKGAESLCIANNNVTLTNGVLRLRPEQSIRVTGLHVAMLDVTLETARGGGGGGGGGAGAAAAASTLGGGGTQRVDAGLLRVQGGRLRLARCRIVNRCPQVALLVTGEGVAHVSKADVASGGAGVLVADAGSEVHMHESRVAHTVGTCVHVGSAAAATLTSSELLHSDLFCGLVVQGRGARAEARVVVVAGHRESNVFVCEGAEAVMHDCRLTQSEDRQSLQARGRGSRVELHRCALSQSRQSGAYVLDGAAVEMHGCTLQGNGIAGVTVQGEGSTARLWGCTLTDNKTAGVHALGGAAAELDGCDVSGGECGAQVKAQGEGSSIAMRATKCTGEVVAADGATINM